MNPPSPLAADGPILVLSGLENPAVPPGTPRVEMPGQQSTLEDRMEALQREMIKMQEHNNILSSNWTTPRNSFSSNSHVQFSSRMAWNNYQTTKGLESSQLRVVHLPKAVCPNFGRTP
ncbi:unnamed protein product [Prunus armeniaca]